MEKEFKELMEKDAQEIGEVIKEVREMRKKIAEEFDYDHAKFIAHCQELETEWRKSGKYKFAKSESAKKNTNPADTTKIQAAD